MTTTVGIDIGGTKISAGVVDEHGTILLSERSETPAKEPDAIVATASSLVRRLRAQHDFEAVGVACAGMVDAERSMVRFAPNIAWRDAPMKAMLEEQIELPVVIENDANAAAWGEFLYGPAREVNDMVLITIGTGVGGGVVFDGQLMRGAFGIAGELGHLRVVPGGHLCGCGNRGCWEQYASGNALVRDGRELMRTAPGLAAGLAEASGGSPKKLKGPDITKAAQSGDAASIELLQDLGRWIGEGAASIAAILDPSMFVLGGGVAEAGDLLLEPAQSAYRRNLSGRGYRPEATWALAHLGNDAGVIGAAALARPDAR
ncbi:glucokinase [Kineosphaera limosa]|uniref:Glucokinase n=1 Tax=Kineosphaera limosa NBRC 100340 TaxID=1184609 RepID=K6WSY6_9MICO|nr:ROK family glucokinase [Kineosphaera limosa]NYD99029.1 glucokinase [Kineosphaera limosa]GAB96936.1 glucokinase [Kineosphaera limosa NBRC 100340]